MKTISFDIKLRKDIQSEENNYQGRYKVQTKNGKSVRIICWDKKDSKFPIVALVKICDSTEAPLSFCNDGKYYPDDKESSDDLCLIDTWAHKFKVGDRVRYRNSDKAVYKIVNVIGSHYVAIRSDQGTRFIPFQNDDFLELVPKESELTDFEKELANCLYKSIGVVCMDGMETLAKEFAPKLLELAKKEIIEKLKEE